MKSEELNVGFAVYWEDMAICRRAGAFWALLHVTVCLPDVCAALESDNGETSRDRYQVWCDKYLHDPLLSAAERYDMRCRVLHQGRAGLKKPGRYTGFAFARPSSPSGLSIHGQIENGTLILDVRRLSEEMEEGVKDWIRRVTGSASMESRNMEQNQPQMARARAFNYQGAPDLPSSTVATFEITRSS